jgi:hypothetical protein
MPGTVGLYYPWIHFRDDDWVKVAMMYWRRVQRIVPPGYRKRDSETVRAFDREGLIADVSPLHSREQVAQVFATVIREREGDLRATYATDGAALWEHAVTRRHVEIPEPDPAVADRFAYIHVDKIAYSLRVALMETGLGVPNRGGDQDWIGVHPAVARVYMTALAEDIARRTGIQPIADDLLNHVAVSGWSVGQLTAALLPTRDSGPLPEPAGEPASALAYVAIQSVVPTNVRSIPAQRILEVREKYGAELLAFQDAIRDLATDADLAGVSDPEAFQMHVQDLYEDRVLPKLDELKRDLRLFRVDTIPTWLSVKTTLPPAAAGTLTGVGLGEPAVATAGAVALGVVALRQASAAEGHDQMRENPAAYMLRLKEALEPSSLRNQLNRAIRKFVRGV